MTKPFAPISTPRVKDDPPKSRKTKASSEFNLNGRKESNILHNAHRNSEIMFNDLIIKHALGKPRNRIPHKKGPYPVSNSLIASRITADKELAERIEAEK